MSEMEWKPKHVKAVAMANEERKELCRIVEERDLAKKNKKKK